MTRNLSKTWTAAIRRSWDKGWQWPLLVVALLAIPVGANLWLLRQAMADPGMAIERDYYRKAVAWDTHLAQQQRSAALGWHLDLQVMPAARTGQPSTVAVNLRDRDGKPIRDAKVVVQAFHNGHASQVLDALAAPVADGYAATLPLVWHGLHEFRFTVTRGADVFTQVVRQDVAVL